MEKGTDTSKIEQVPYFILQPIIDLLQYRVFCERVEVELQKAVQGLNAAGIPSTLSFTGVGESGQHIVSLLSDTRNKVIGGEAVIRIDDWYGAFSSCLFNIPDLHLGILCGSHLFLLLH